MCEVVGYLRRYRRWDGTPGLKLADQRQLVNQVAHEFGYKPARRHLTEKADGEAQAWPALRNAIDKAIDDADLELLVVIPTLDGVQFNLSFLDRLVGAACQEAPVYVRSGWRRPKRFGTKRTYRRRAERPGWFLSQSDEADAFKEMVDRVRERSRALRESVGPGLKAASRQGIKIGARHPNAHRYTQSERSRGGRATAAKRRRLANEPYQKWINDICTWHRQGVSLGQIATRLAAKRVVKPDGGRIGRMLVYRILKRAQSELAEYI